MKKHVQATLLILCAVCSMSARVSAQGTLIHYWHFNNYTSVYTYPQTFPIGPVDADFSIHDTSKARIYLATFPGTSPTWHSTSSTIMDPVTTVATDYDTVNLRMGALGGNGLRPRNQLDSAYLMMYIPTNNYQNIKLTYASQSSSTGSGDTYQLFEYSTDSGATWQTSGLSMLQDSAWLVFHRTTITFSNPLVNNNSRLVFRIHFVGHNNGTSGNNRFDNVSVDGDSIIAPVPIHYWHFNNYTTTYTYPQTFPIGAIDADYSAIDTSKARIYLATFPGTSPTWHSTSSTIMDPVSTVATDYDTVNIRFGAPAGNGLRPRNQLDSAYLMFYMPTNGYHDVILNYASQSSSTGSGDTYQIFDYSVDSGATWKTSGLSKLQDSAWLVYHRCTVTFSDTFVNNNKKFVFRIHFVGHNNGTSGNNRFDNVSLDGIPYISANSITTTTAPFGPYCNASAAPISVAYTSAGTFTGAYSVQLSNPGGTFPNNTTSNLIGTGATSPISANIPAGTAAGSYRVRVINSTPATYGTDNGNNIVVNAPPTAYAVTGGGGFCAGGSGVAVGLAGSQTGVNYQLYIGGSTAVGSPVAGTNSAITFGSKTTGGAYTVQATVTATPACASTMTGSVTVTVNPVPSNIAGTTTICAGNSVVLSDTITGGTWSSNFTSVATINSTTGVLSGISSGIATISYILPGGCYKTTLVIVNGPFAGITGTASVCPGGVTALSDIGAGVSWVSSDNSIATVDPFGNVSGVSAGTATISFIQSPGCYASTAFTVNPNPGTITGNLNVCAGSFTILGSSPAGGGWSIDNTSLATVNGSGVVSGISDGGVNVTYTLGTGCSTSSAVSVHALPSPILGTAIVCVQSTTTLSDDEGGTWSSSNTGMATVDASSGVVTGVSGGTPTITYTSAVGCTATQAVLVNSLPLPISGNMPVCAGSTVSLSDGTSGGSWTSSDVSLATVDGSGLVSGIAAGNLSISYTSAIGCSISVVASVNPLPDAIAGNTNVCFGLTTTLSDGGSGTWASSDLATATVETASGVVHGVATGAVTITYTLPTGCVTTTAIAVNPLPDAITGTATVCSGFVTNLADDMPGGSWTSGNTAMATADAVSGAITGVSAGNPLITYTLPTGCMITATITVNASPAAITGNINLCEGLNTNLHDLTPGGSWSSSNTALASIDASTGYVSGIAAGNPTITYLQAWNGCYSSTVLNVNPLPAAIGGIMNVCAGGSTILGDAGGGTWSSGNTSRAVIGLTNGVVTAISPGTAAITYTLPTGCITTSMVTVNAPATITGTRTVCQGTGTILTPSITGGLWSSGNTAIASVDIYSGSVSGLAPGYVLITYQTPLGCITGALVTVNATPSSAFSVTGGGNFCAGGAGVPIGLSGSNAGVSYQMMKDGVPTGAAVFGAGTPLSFGVSTMGGTYTIKGTDPATGCNSIMTGNAVVVVNSLPTAYAVLGGGSYCSGTGGLHIGTSGSEPGVSYQLMHTITHVGSPLAGTGGALDFGLITTDETYTVLAINSTTGCINNMAGSATVVTLPLPVVFTITGGGNYCAGGAGVSIGLAYTNPGVSYQLFNGATPSGAGMVSAGGPLDFGLRTAPGAYHVIGTYTGSGCSSAMGGTASVGINPLVVPAVSISTGVGDTICSGSYLTINAMVSNAGVIPVYNWTVNGTAHPGYTNSFTYMPSDGDIVALQVMSSAVCPAVPSVSASLGLTVMDRGMPGVSVSADPVGTVCRGTLVSYTANSVFGGLPSFSWYVNGVNVGTFPFYTYTPSDHDDIYVQMVSNYFCREADTVNSEHMIMSVNTPFNPTVTLYENPGNDIAHGQPVTFTANVGNGGPDPLYQWYVNGTPVTGAVFPTYSGSNFNNGDSVSCQVVSSGICAGLHGHGSVTMHVSTVGVSRLSGAGNNVLLVPNPNRGAFTLKGTLGTSEQNASVEITDMLGQVVYTGSVALNNGEINEVIHLQGMANGMYLLNLQSASAHAVFHFVIEQ